MKQFAIKSAIFAAVATVAAIPAGAAVVVAAGSSGTTGDTALYLNQASEISAEANSGATAEELATMLGAPDDQHTGIGSFYVTYDLGNYRVIDGTGADFNVYEVDFGGNEFDFVDVLVSADGSNFYNIDSTLATARDLAGDELHSSATFRRSFDVGVAVTASGATQFRYLRLDGTLGGQTAINGNNGFDPESVGFANFVTAAAAVPEPSTWAVLIVGFAAVGGAMRRRRSATLAMAATC